MMSVIGQHENIVTLVRYSIHDNSYYMVYEFYRGDDLHKVLFDARSEIKLDWEQKLILS